MSNVNQNSTITLNKKEHTNLTLNTARKYVESNIYFDLNVREANAEMITESEVVIESNQPTGNGYNISDSIGQKSAVEPEEGYFIRLKSSATSSFNIETSGWIEQGDVQNNEDETTEFYLVEEATFSKNGTINVTPVVNVSQSNVLFSNVNNGISVTAVGGGQSSAAASFSVSHSGYTDNMKTETINLNDSQTNTVTQFISGVSIESPSNGNNSFSVEIPNNNTTVTLTFSVDSNGNTVIE